jgi:protein-tyrosine phosphatase
MKDSQNAAAEQPQKDAAAVRLLFICTGNICRSPTAEGVFRARAALAGLEHRFRADSAGTHGYHVGEAPDPRSCAAALRRGVDLSSLRGRKLTVQDFDRFDLVLAMDRGHLRALQALAPPGKADRAHLFLRFAPRLGLQDVPDPYYGGPDGFERVLDMIEAACDGLLEHLTQTGLTRP